MLLQQRSTNRCFTSSFHLSVINSRVLFFFFVVHSNFNKCDIARVWNFFHQTARSRPNISYVVGAILRCLLSPKTNIFELSNAPHSLWSDTKTHLAFLRLNSLHSEMLKYWRTFHTYHRDAIRKLVSRRWSYSSALGLNYDLSINIVANFCRLRPSKFRLIESRYATTRYFIFVVYSRNTVSALREISRVGVYASL